MREYHVFARCFYPSQWERILTRVTELCLDQAALHPLDRVPVSEHPGPLGELAQPGCPTVLGQVA